MKLIASLAICYLHIYIIRAIARASLYDWLAIQRVRPDHVDYELRLFRKSVQVIVLELRHFDAFNSF
jgi:hypothetical protein